MRILHVITRLILGGAQQNTVLSCAAQGAAGHEVHLAYGPIHGPEGSLLDEARASGATLHEVPPMVRAVRPIRDWRCQRALRGLVREIQPDLVHTHSSKAGILGRAAAWAQRRGGRPIVVHTIHGLPFHPRQPRAVQRLYVGLERWAARRCDHLVAITPAMVDAFVTERIAPRQRFTVIPSGVDLRHFDGPAISVTEARAALGLDPGSPVIGLVARLDPLKGHRDLLAALPAILEAHPRTQVLFLGDGFDAAGIAEAVGAAGLADRVHMLGLRPWGDMPGVYRAIDVLVLPSYQEGQSRVLVEGLLAGCAVVAYAAGGIPSVCIDGKTGRLAPVGDTAALGRAIIDLLDDPDQRQRLSRAGRAHVAEHFSAEAMNGALLALYERLANAARA